MTRGLGSLLLIALLGACSDDEPAPAGASSDLPACQWPAAFEPANVEPRGCRAARTFLECDTPSGFLSCMSDNLESCPPSVPIADYSNCRNQCAPGEFALACGGVGPGPVPEPPPVCRSVLSGPGGQVFHCCPCGG